jgi:glycerophosphoryl diester phosphodiesterase
MSEMLPAYPFYEGTTGTIPVAHGANTMVELEQAARLGYQYAEIDTIGTRDDVLLAFHGPSLRQRYQAGVPSVEEIGNMTVEEAQHAITTNGEPGISVEELITVYPDMRFFIDVKNARSARPLARLINNRSLHERVSVGAFNYRYARAIRDEVRSGGPICTTIGTAGSLALAATRLNFSRAAEYIKQSGATEFALPFVLSTTTERAHHLGMRVLVWTPNKERQVVSSLAKGVDGIMSDEVELLKQLTDQAL